MSFGSDITAFVNKNEKRSEKFYRKISVAGLAGMQTISPVDTGAFKNDWGVTVGNENNQKQSPYTLNIKDNDIYIRNTMPYAEKLEHGLSDQATNGIIRVVAKELKYKIEAGLYNDR